MVIVICPRCQRRVVSGQHTSDVIHDCDSRNPALDQEDIAVISTTADEFGEVVSTGRSAASIMNQGNANVFMGTRPGIDGVHDTTNFSPRGARNATHRQRSHFEYINLDVQKAKKSAERKSW